MMPKHGREAREKGMKAQSQASGLRGKAGGAATLAKQEERSVLTASPFHHRPPELISELSYRL
jgi:hypothetical protein